jgi:hypothetical protein
MKTFNFADRRLNKEQEIAFISGYEAKIKEVESMGWNSARDKFNLDNPADQSPSMLGYAFACGEMEALLDTK